VCDDLWGEWHDSDTVGEGFQFHEFRGCARKYHAPSWELSQRWKCLITPLLESVNSCLKIGLSVSLLTVGLPMHMAASPS